MWFVSGGFIVKPRQITNTTLGASFASRGWPWPGQGRGRRSTAHWSVLDTFFPKFRAFFGADIDRVWEALAGRMAGSGTLRRGIMSRAGGPGHNAPLCWRYLPGLAVTAGCSVYRLSGVASAVQCTALSTFRGCSSYLSRVANMVAELPLPWFCLC